MTKLHRSFRVGIYVLLYLIANLAFLPLGNIIEDIPFAFGMIQLTLFTALLCVRYEIVAAEMKKIARQPLKHLILLLVCGILFSVAAMSSYLKLLDSRLLVAINPETNKLLIAGEILMILLFFPANEIFLLKQLSTLGSRQSEQTRLMISAAVYVVIRCALFYIVNPAGWFIHILFAVITACCGAMLIRKNISLMLYPIAVLAIGTMFTFI